MSNSFKKYLVGTDDATTSGSSSVAKADRLRGDLDAKVDVVKDAVVAEFNDVMDAMVLKLKPDNSISSKVGLARRFWRLMRLSLCIEQYPKMSSICAPAALRAIGDPKLSFAAKLYCCHYAFQRFCDQMKELGEPSVVNAPTVASMGPMDVNDGKDELKLVEVVKDEWSKLSSSQKQEHKRVEESMDIPVETHVLACVGKTCTLHEILTCATPLVAVVVVLTDPDLPSEGKYYCGTKLLERFLPGSTNNPSSSSTADSSHAKALTLGPA